MDDISKNQGVKVISRAADILRALAEDTQGLSLGQIASRVGLPRSTVQRLVNALLEEGFVTAGRSARGIRLGPQIQSLAEAARVDLAEVLGPTIKSISEETGETVDLAVLEGSQMLFIGQVVGSHRLRTVSNIGERFPLSTPANGKAALALLDEAEATRLVLDETEQGKLERSVTELLAEIAEIRRTGIARDENEHTEGISALGFALRDSSGRIIALSVPVPTARYLRIRDNLTKTLVAWKERLQGMQVL